MAYKKTKTVKSVKFEKLQLGEQEKLALFLFEQKQSNIKQPLLIRDLYFMCQTPQQIHAIEKLGARL